MSDNKQIAKETVDKILDNLTGVVFTPESKLSTDLGCDSLDVVEIVMDLEDKLHIEIADDEVANTDETYTVQQLYDLVTVKLDGLQ